MSLVVYYLNPDDRIAVRSLSELSEVSHLARTTSEPMFIDQVPDPAAEPLPAGVAALRQLGELGTPGLVVSNRVHGQLSPAMRSAFLATELRVEGDSSAPVYLHGHRRPHGFHVHARNPSNGAGITASPGDSPAEGEVSLEAAALPAHASIAWTCSTLPQALHARPLRSLCGLTRHIRRALHEQGLLTVADLASISDEELLSWRRFGFLRLAALRRALLRLREFPHELATDGFDPDASPRELGTVLSDLAQEIPSPFLGFPLERLTGLSARARNALAARGLCTINALIGTSDGEFLSWPNCGVKSLRSLASGLEELGDQIQALLGAGMDPSLGALLRSQTTSVPLMEYLKARIATLPARNQAVCERRLFPVGSGETLEEVGLSLDLTRERVRQIENTCRRVLDPHGDIVAFLDGRLDALRVFRTAPLLLDELAASDPWFEGISSDPVRFQCALGALSSRHVLLCPEGGEPLVTDARVASLQDVADQFKRTYSGKIMPEDVPKSLHATLVEVGAPELVPCIEARLTASVELGCGIVYDPRFADLVEAVFFESGQELSIPEVEERLRTRGVSFGASAVRGAVSTSRFLGAGPGRFVLATLLSRWDCFREPLVAASISHMESQADRQWGVAELLDMLKAGNFEWAHSMPLHVVDYLLGLEPSRLVRLGLGLWSLDTLASVKRIPLHKLALQFVKEAGGPIPHRELRHRIREHRSVGHQLRIVWPLVHFLDGRIGYGPRDLDLSDDQFERVMSEVRQRIEDTRRVSASELQEVIARHAPAALQYEPRLLARIFSPDQTLRMDGDGVRHRSVPAR